MALAFALRTVRLDQVPPGLFYDEAANGIDALDVLGGWRPVFFPGNQGREPLHIYLTAVATALVGPGWLAVRLPALLAGMLAIPATYLLGREVGGRPVGLLAALALATSYWHVSLSRTGFRAGWMPVVVALGLALVLRMVRTGGIRPAIAAGLVVGIGLYTYLAARVVPGLLVFVPALAILLARPRPPVRVLLLPLAVATVVATPLGVYFLRHPELFWGRIETASGGALGPLERALTAFGTFVWAGDPQARHNLPERPAFEPIAGGLFLLGVALCARRWRTVPHAALPVAIGLMLLPQALATGEPHYLRAAGALPLACVVVAVGLWAVLVRVPSRAWRVGLTGGLGLLWTIGTAGAYFGEWAPSRDAYQAFEGQGRDAARLVASLPPDEPVAAGSPIYNERPTFFFGSPRPVSAFEAVQVVVVPPGGTAVVLPGSYDRRVAPRDELGQPVALLGPWDTPDGAPAAALYRVDARALAPRWALEASFGGVVALQGYDADAVVAPGGEQAVALTWRVLAAAPAGVRQFVHALTQSGGAERVLAGADADPFPSRSWRGGETVRSWYALAIPPEAPVGAFWIETGFYQADGLQRLPAADPAGRAIGDRLVFGPFKIWDPRLARPRPAAPLAELAGGVLLAGAELPPSARPGESLPVRLTWWSERPTAAPLTGFVHLLDAESRQRAGADAPPVGGANPTSVWQPGETIVDQRTVQLAPDLPAGTYVVEAGLYEPTSGARLPLVAAASRLGDAVILGRIEVR